MARNGLLIPARLVENVYAIGIRPARSLIRAELKSKLPKGGPDSAFWVRTGALFTILWTTFSIAVKLATLRQTKLGSPIVTDAHHSLSPATELSAYHQHPVK